LAVFIFLVVLLLMTIFFFQDFSRSEFKRRLLVYD